MKASSLRTALTLLIAAQVGFVKSDPNAGRQSPSSMAAATVIPDDGWIRQDQTWSGDILASRTVTVAPGVTLTIAPGAAVRFEPKRPLFVSDPTLYVYGRLIATGTAEKPIRFTSNATQPAPGDWGGIRFFRGSAGSILDHVIIEYSMGAVYPEDKITVSNSIIRWMLGTTFPVYGDATITRNRIYGAGCNAFEIHYHTKPSITYNTISGAGAAGLQVLEGSSPTIAHNIIKGNGTGIDLSALASVDLQYNSITNNGSGLSLLDSVNTASSIVQHNNIQDNVVNVSVMSAQTLDAPNNWWGTAQAAAIAATMHIESGGKVVYQPYENQRVDIGNITYDWNNSETYDFKAPDLTKYFYLENDTTRDITALVRSDLFAGGTMGIAWDGQYLWASISEAGKAKPYIHKLDATGKSLVSFPTPAIEPMGLAFDGQNLWVVDYAPSFVHEVDRTGKLLRSIPAPCQEPQGLAFDGQYFWTLSNQTPGRSYQFDKTGKLIRTLDTRGYAGIAWDGKFLWVSPLPEHLAQVDPSNGHIVRMITASGSMPGFLTFQGDELWVEEYGIGGFYAQEPEWLGHEWLVKMRPSKETITLDGLRTDWQGRAPLVTDPQGDNVGAATDIKSLYGFMDDGDLYLMLDFYQLSGYDFATLEFDIDGDGKADYSVGGFFPGDPRTVMLHDNSTRQDRWIRTDGTDVRGTEMHSNAKEVAEFKIPRSVFGNRSSIAVRCYLIKSGTGSDIDHTDWGRIEGPRDALDLAMNPGGAAGQITADEGATRIGYAKVQNNAGPAPHGTAVFSFKQNGIVVTEASVPASPPTTKARIFIDYRSSVAAVPGRLSAGRIDINTGIALVNYGGSTASVTYTLRDAQGAPLSVGHGSIPAGNHISCFINELKEKAAPDFNLRPDFQSAIQFGSLEVASDQTLSVLALRATTNQRNEFLLTTTPIADLTQPSTAGSLYFPQFADGGGYTTSLILLNTSDHTESGTLEILNDQGKPLAVNPVGGTSGSSFRYSVPANGVFRFQSDGALASVTTGWVRLTPDPQNETPIGSGVFAYNPNSVLVTESGIPAAGSTTHARVRVDLSGRHNTGLALANTTSANAEVSMRALQSDGVTDAGASAGSLSLAGYGHGAKFANELITGLPPGFVGVLDISSTTPFAALTLRSLVNERGDFLLTTFPIADANRDAPSPIVFPQIADGGGYTTEFVLVSSGRTFWPSKVTLEFLGETGAPLPVVK